MLIFDLETDGLLNDVTKIHCLVIHDDETNKTLRYNDEGNQEPIVRGVQIINDAPCICGHNIIGYDLLVIQKLYPWFKPVGDVIDTLLLSRLFYTNLLAIDHKNTWKNMPPQLYGRHSLEAYGYRLGEYKGNFCKDTDWANWSPDIEDYSEQDVLVTTKLLKKFVGKINDL